VFSHSVKKVHVQCVAETILSACCIGWAVWLVSSVSPHRLEVDIPEMNYMSSDQPYPGCAAGHWLWHGWVLADP
jgi:hypothetical protein